MFEVYISGYFSTCSWGGIQESHIFEQKQSKMSTLLEPQFLDKLIFEWKTCILWSYI